MQATQSKQPHAAPHLRCPPPGLPRHVHQLRLLLPQHIPQPVEYGCAGISGEAGVTGGLVAACRPPQRIPARVAQLLWRQMGGAGKRHQNEEMLCLGAPAAAAAQMSACWLQSSGGTQQARSGGAHLVQACRQLHAAQQLAPVVQHQAQVAIKQQLPRG